MVDMMRTRDFVLVFSVLAFVVIGLGGTLLGQWLQGEITQDISPANVLPASSEPSATIGARIPADTTDQDRAERLETLRAKIAQVELDEVVAPESQEPTTVATTSGVTQADEVIRCADVSAYGKFWDARGVTVEPREGAVVVQRMLETGPQVVLQLAARTQPSATPSCLATDVIGIANDGSLIRNDERDLYAIFGSETRIGYALDGFPIHGVSTVRGDVCGGRLVGGQYRYELSPDRAAVLNCFASAPAVLP